MYSLSRSAAQDGARTLVKSNSKADLVCSVSGTNMISFAWYVAIRTYVRTYHGLNSTRDPTGFEISYVYVYSKKQYIINRICVDRITYWMFYFDEIKLRKSEEKP